MPQIEDQVADLNDFAADLLEWYWRFGRERKGGYQIGMQWLSEAADLKQSLASAVEVSNRDRGGVAVWGPSQAGKSTLLSQFIDDPDGERSAIDWKDDGGFRFVRSTRHASVGALNPYNQKSDASGCVTRFYLADTVEDTDHPVTLHFGDRQALMHALAAGYADECDKRTPQTGEPVILTREVLLDMFPAGDDPIDPDAFDLARDVALTVERLISDEKDRFNPIRRTWAEELRLKWQRSATSLEQTDAAARRILWDDRSGLNELYAQLDAARRRLEAAFGDRSVRCSLAFASLLLDIDTYSSLRESALAPDASQETSSEEETSEDDPVARTLKGLLEIRYKIDGDKVVIGEDGERLFKDAFEFGLFQGLVWCIDVPLRDSFVRERSNTVAELMDQADIYDIPGVARAETGVMDSLIRPDEGGADAAELLAKVLKRGKTGSIITRFALERRFDGVLILVKAGNPPSKPSQLESGVAAIWQNIDPDRTADAPPRVPTFLNLTFFGAEAAEWAEAGISRGGLEGPGATLRTMPRLSDPNLVTMFFTDYPHLSGGRPQLDEEAATKLIGGIKKDSWFKSQFTSDVSRASVEHSLRDRDGGVVHMLGALSRALGQRASDAFVGEAVSRGRRKITSLLVEAAPRRDDSVDHDREALAALGEAMRRKLRRSRGDGADEVRRLIHKAFGMPAKDLGLLPQYWRSKRELRQYFDEQFASWVERPEAYEALTELGVEDREQPTAIRAVIDQIDRRALADWLATFLPNSLNARQRDRYKRNIAVAMTNQATGNIHVDADRPYGEAEDLKRCQERFDIWLDGDEGVDSPHYSLSVAPFLKHLEAISETLSTHDWEPQPGDAEIEALQKRFTQPATVSA